MSQKLVMYDVIGIQNYIFRTAKMRDAIGASYIVENIIEEALEYAAKKEGSECSCDLKWYMEKGTGGQAGPLSFDETNIKNIQVLYIGGGNAYVIFDSQMRAERVSKRMAKYVLDKTYSLMLAVAMANKTDDYSGDYEKLSKEMDRVKARMVVSKPLGSLPVMDVEIKTGFPISKRNARNEQVSTESWLKEEAVEKKRQNLKKRDKILDNLIDGKNVDSMLAVVHIDGNNMALRIKKLINRVKDYSEAVNLMREISYRISSTYKTVFEDMKAYFDDNSLYTGKFEDKLLKDLFVMCLITAGDDITYICNAKIALATVEYFFREITKYSMYDNKDEDDPNQYVFSVCAGISYFKSHFPFDVAYDVAEACCKIAKDRAKKITLKTGADELVGNWFDFQFCRSVQCRDLERIRNEQYMTAGGEQLLRRPYYVSVADFERFEGKVPENLKYSTFIRDMKKYVLDTKKNIPRSYVKELRDTYPLGREQVGVLRSFLMSRNRSLPENLYFKSEGEETETALLYDALEVADYFISLTDMEQNCVIPKKDGEGDETVN